MKVYFAMFSFWKIMVVCSNHLRLTYNISASLLPHYSHVGKGIGITTQSHLSGVSCL